MKKFTNHAAGPRGINTAAGTVWLDPGETVEVDAKDIVGDLPDFGKAPAADSSDDDSSLQPQVDDLTKQVAALTKDKADLTKQVETLTKPK